MEKTCKHCGGEDNTVLRPCYWCSSCDVELSYFDLADTYSIICRDCGAKFSFVGAKGTKRDVVIAAWNGDFLTPMKAEADADE